MDLFDAKHFGMLLLQNKIFFWAAVEDLIWLENLSWPASVQTP
jgi:hypothetical protein